MGRPLSLKTGNAIKIFFGLIDGFFLLGRNLKIVIFEEIPSVPSQAILKNITPIKYHKFCINFVEHNLFMYKIFIKIFIKIFDQILKKLYEQKFSILTFLAKIIKKLKFPKDFLITWFRDGQPKLVCVPRLEKLPKILTL